MNSIIDDPRFMETESVPRLLARFAVPAVVGDASLSDAFDLLINVKEAPSTAGGLFVWISISE